MCTFQMRLITWIDWFNAVEPIALSSDTASRIAPQLQRQDLLEQIHLVSTAGQIYRGARALRFIGMRIPLMIPLALILWIPGVIWVAQHGYMFVAHRRHTLSKLFGCKGACAIVPEKPPKTKSRSSDPPSESALQVEPLEDRQMF
jgi:predicted DCC family thiol-disulfide oxidoreductase YuxK